MRLTYLGTVAMWTIAAVPIFSHDMWIEPATFTPRPGEIVPIKLRVGQDLIGDPLPRDPSLIQHFIVEDAAGRRPVVGRDGANPAGFVGIGVPGLQVVGYRSNRSSNRQTAEKFDRYLKEEGLEAVGRRQRPSDAQVHELFSRCAKSLVLAGAPGAEGDRALGFTLELVAERNPFALRKGEELPVRLLYHGKPLAGALVAAINRLSPAGKVSARTGRDGRVRLTLGARGMWMIKAVHMIPAPAGSGADWESFWASLTFEVRN